MASSPIRGQRVSIPGAIATSIDCFEVSLPYVSVASYVPGRTKRIPSPPYSVSTSFVGFRSQEVRLIPETAVADRLATVWACAFLISILTGSGPPSLIQNESNAPSAGLVPRYTVEPDHSSKPGRIDRPDALRTGNR